MMKDDDYPCLIRPWHETLAANHSLFSTPLETELPPDPGEVDEQEVVDLHNRANQQLRDVLLGRILAQTPDFFEHLIIDLMLAMGYGGRRRDMARKLGRRGDNGVDGVIEQDILGLDLIYLQAKRLRPGTPVPAADVRDFVGSLEAHRATKGVFMTTGLFTKASRRLVEQISRQVILIDGNRLTDLMIRFNIGVKVLQTLQFKRLDTDYFSPAAFQARTTKFEEPIAHLKMARARSL